MTDKMQSVGQIIKNNPVLKSQEPIAISQPPLPSLGVEEAIEQLEQAGAPKWTVLVLQMAQDKRHDLAPHALRFWKVKLQPFADSLVCEAMTTGRWDLFPSVDDVIGVIEVLQETKHAERGYSEWEQYKARQEQAAKAGKLATEEDYALMRNKLREVFGAGGKPTEKSA